MSLPFTADEFFNVFEAYNLTIWPVPIVAYILGIAAILLATRDTQVQSRIVTVILALFGGWMGV
jgi:hypothetical protein